MIKRARNRGVVLPLVLVLSTGVTLFFLLAIDLLSKSSGRLFADVSLHKIQEQNLRQSIIDAVSLSPRPARGCFGPSSICLRKTTYQKPEFSICDPSRNCAMPLFLIESRQRDAQDCPGVLTVTDERLFPRRDSALRGAHTCRIGTRPPIQESISYKDNLVFDASVAFIAARDSVEVFTIGSLHAENVHATGTTTIFAGGDLSIGTLSFHGGPVTLVSATGKVSVQRNLGTGRLLVLSRDAAEIQATGFTVAELPFKVSNTEVVGFED